MLKKFLKEKNMVRALTNDYHGHPSFKPALKKVPGNKRVEFAKKINYNLIMTDGNVKESILKASEYINEQVD